jgi:hypothetical protein
MVPNFVKNEIINNPGAITSDTDFQLILDVILYLAGQGIRPIFSVVCQSCLSKMGPSEPWPFAEQAHLTIGGNRRTKLKGTIFLNSILSILK